MKVNSLQNYNNRPLYNANSNPNKRNNNPSFGSAASLAVNFWDAVARGGFAASFTVQDMTGTNFPRTYKALQRNKKITGKNNYKAASEVAIREFMTGPSMCAIPMFVLALSKKAFGKANEVPLENIAPFSDKMKEILENTAITRTDLDFPKNSPVEFSKRMKNAFYEKMFALSLGEEAKQGQEVSKEAKELAQMLMEYDNAPKRGVMKQILNKDLKETVNDGSKRSIGDKIKAKDQIFEDMVTKFTDAKKLLTDDYTTLLKSDMSGLLDKENSVPSLIKDISNFGCDVQETMVKRATKNGAIVGAPLDFKSFMDEFKIRRSGSKYITNVLMVLATALFMLKIPKIYSSLHKTNPETDAFRSEEGEVIRANQ